MNRYSLVLVTLSSLVLGCGADAESACEEYLAAWQGCLDEAYAGDDAAADAAAAALEGACDPYAGLKGKDAKEAADLLTCYADTISAGDCSDATTYTTTISSIVDCG